MRLGYERRDRRLDRNTDPEDGADNERRRIAVKKYEVIKNYTDRITGESRWIGMEVELTDARAKELREGGYIKTPSKTTKEK